MELYCLGRKNSSNREYHSEICQLFNLKINRIILIVAEAHRMVINFARSEPRKKMLSGLIPFACVFPGGKIHGK